MFPIEVFDTHWLWYMSGHSVFMMVSGPLINFNIFFFFICPFSLEAFRVHRHPAVGVWVKQNGLLYRDGRNSLLKHTSQGRILGQETSSQPIA